MARRSSVFFASLAALSAIAVLFLPPAQATFPGRNGSLAFSAYSLNPESSDIVVDREVIGAARLPGRPHIFGVGSSPAFSPDGRWIAYQAESESSQPGIWLARSDCRWPKTTRSAPPCSRLRRLTRRDTDEAPAWSPNGKRIAFVRSRLGYGHHRIYSVPARGGGGLRLLVGRGHQPDWSKSGALAFVVGQEGPILVRQPGGRIRSLGVRGSEPSWAPSGDRLAFTVSDHSPATYDLYIINADGTGLRKIRDGGVEEAPFNPTWSPDGRSIAFIETFMSGYTGWVYAIRPNGHGLRVLMRDAKCRFCADTANFDDLAWQALR